VGGLTPLQFEVREGAWSRENAGRGGPDVNQKSEFGWTALAGRHSQPVLQIGVYLLDHGADPKHPQRGRLDTAYYRNDTGTSKAATTHSQTGHGPSRLHQRRSRRMRIRICACARAPRRAPCSRTSGCSKEGATPFLAPAQSGDIVLLQLLLEHGADASMTTDSKSRRCMVASGHRLG